MLDYAALAKAGSMYNTPPTWAIYVAGAVFEWAQAQGGVEEFARRSAAKSGRIYDIIDASDGFYTAPVAAAVRSRMNVPFRVCGCGGGDGGDGAASAAAAPNDALEASFLEKAAAKGLLQLKGHRSVGGIRASLYNAVTLAETEKLAEFMLEFMQTEMAAK